MRIGLELPIPQNEYPLGGRTRWTDAGLLHLSGYLQGFEGPFLQTACHRFRGCAASLCLHGGFARRV